ncbi:hypothetical protein AOLI_G00199640 [Acnodon oligacanthus]
MISRCSRCIKPLEALRVLLQTPPYQSQTGKSHICCCSDTQPVYTPPPGTPKHAETKISHSPPGHFRRRTGVNTARRRTEGPQNPDHSSCSSKAALPSVRLEQTFTDAHRFPQTQLAALMEKFALNGEPQAAQLAGLRPAPLGHSQSNHSVVSSANEVAESRSRWDSNCERLSVGRPAAAAAAGSVSYDD